MYTYEKIISKCYLPLHILCKEINKRRNKREELNKKSNIVHPRWTLAKFIYRFCGNLRRWCCKYRNRWLSERSTTHSLRSIRWFALILHTTLSAFKSFWVTATNTISLSALKNSCEFSKKRPSNFTHENIFKCSSERYKYKSSSDKIQSRLTHISPMSSTCINANMYIHSIGRDCFVLPVMQSVVLWMMQNTTISLSKNSASMFLTNSIKYKNCNFFSRSYSNLYIESFQ